MNKKLLINSVLAILASVITLYFSIISIDSEILRDIILTSISTVIIGGIALTVSSYISQKLYVERKNSPNVEKFQNSSTTVPARKQPINRNQIFDEFIHIYTFYIDVENRISTEISNISRRAYLNLLLGLGTSLIALAGLFINLINSTDSQNLNTNNWILTFFLPRISFAILVEALAFYFLRIYKESLETIKYLTNELTNIDMKVLSILVAMEHNNRTTLDKVVDSLASTERNNILKKGESTVELLKQSQNSNNFEKIFDSILTNIKNLKK